MRVALFSAALFIGVLLAGSAAEGAAPSGPRGTPPPAPSPKALTIIDPAQDMERPEPVGTKRPSPSRGFGLMVQALLSPAENGAARDRLAAEDSPSRPSADSLRVPVGGHLATFNSFARRIADADLMTRPEGTSDGVNGVIGRRPATRTLAPFAISDEGTRPEQFPGGSTLLRGAALTLGGPHGPSATLGLTRTGREPGGEELQAANPLRRAALDPVTHAALAQIVWAWRFLTVDASVAGSRSSAPSRPGREGAALAYNAALSFHLLDDRLVLGPTLSWVDTRTMMGGAEGLFAGGSTGSARMLLGGIAATGELVPGRLTFDAQVGLTGTSGGRRDDRQAPDLTSGNGPGRRAVIADAFGRLAWTFGGASGGPGRHSLSLEVAWSRVLAPAGPPKNQNDLGIFLGLDLSVPFLF